SKNAQQDFQRFRITRRQCPMQFLGNNRDSRLQFKRTDSLGNGSCECLFRKARIARLDERGETPGQLLPEIFLQRHRGHDGSPSSPPSVHTASKYCWRYASEGGMMVIISNNTPLGSAVIK